jgi:hypothetical protein
MEENRDLLMKADEIRKRMDISYEEAVKALELNGNDAVKAVVYLENKAKRDQTAEVTETGAPPYAKVEIYRKDQSLDVPMPVAAISALLLLKKPKLLVLGAIALLASGADVRFHNRNGGEVELTKKARAEAKKAFGYVSGNGTDAVRKAMKKRKFKNSVDNFQESAARAAKYFVSKVE